MSGNPRKRAKSTTGTNSESPENVVHDYPDGRKYRGGWLNGKPHGYGVFTCTNGEKYTGYFKNGKPDGIGTYIYSGGERYEGGFSDGWRHGYGAIIHADGTTKDGMWEHGELMPLNKTIIIYPDKGKYEGTVLQGEPHGKGVYEHPSGYKYGGEWRRGKKHGHGVETSPDGKECEGEWKDGKSYRTTKITNSDGSRIEYKGNFNGTIFFSDNSIYEGGIIRDKPSGIGTLTFPGKCSYTGLFSEGKPIGEITIKYDEKSGSKFKSMKAIFGKNGKIDVTKDVNIICTDGEIYEGRLFIDSGFVMRMDSIDLFRHYIAPSCYISIKYKQEPKIFEYNSKCGNYDETNPFKYYGRVYYYGEEGKIFPCSKGRLEYPKGHELREAKGTFKYIKDEGRVLLTGYVISRDGTKHEVERGKITRIIVPSSKMLGGEITEALYGGIQSIKNISDSKVEITYNDRGILYKGEVVGETPHGQGELVFPGYQYKGQFREGKPFGIIEIIYDPLSDNGYKTVKVKFDDCGKIIKDGKLIPEVEITFGEDSDIHEYKGELKIKGNIAENYEDPLVRCEIPDRIKSAIVTYRKEPHIFGEEGAVQLPGYKYSDTVESKKYYTYKGDVKYDKKADQNNRFTFCKFGELKYPEGHVLDTVSVGIFNVRGTVYAGNIKYSNGEHVFAHGGEFLSKDESPSTSPNNSSSSQFVPKTTSQAQSPASQ